MPDLYVSWSEYHQKIEQLALQIYQSSWDFSHIVCLARGGLRVGDILSRLYRKPLAILSATSYTGKNRGAIKFSEHLSMTSNQLGNRVLLADDLVDSGISLREAVSWLKEHHGREIEQIRTAVVWCKASSVVVPDYYVDYLDDNPWIHQPFECYELMTVEELANNNATKSL